MDDRTIENRVSNRSPRRRGRRAYYLVAVLAAAVVVAMGIGLWSATRPRYLTMRSMPVGADRAAVEIVYPADWSASDYSTIDPSDEGALRIAGVHLSRRLPTGLQKWIEEKLIRTSNFDWQLVTVNVQLMSVSNYRDLDSEMSRMQFIMRQLVRRGGSFAVHKDRCAAGDILVIDMEGAATTGLGNYHTTTYLIHPPAGSSGRQYEIVVRYTAPRKLNERVNRVVRDVVSRIRLVRNSDTP